LLLLLLSLLLLLLNGRERSQLKKCQSSREDEEQKPKSNGEKAKKEHKRKQQNARRTSSNNRSPFSTPQNASISALVSSHLRSVKSYSTFGKYVCQSKGATDVSRGRYWCRCPDDWRREDCSSILLDCFYCCCLTGVKRSCA